MNNGAKQARKKYEKKQGHIMVRVNIDRKNKFKNICKSNNVSMNKILTNCINELIQSSENINQLSKYKINKSKNSIKERRNDNERFIGIIWQKRKC